MYKKIRIGFADFWPGFDPRDNFFTRLLRRRYPLEITDRPDFLFFSWFGRSHLAHDCVRIYYTGENDRPDFNVCDYAFSFDFNDHPNHYRLPLYALYLALDQLVKKDWDAERLLAEKTGFCSFVISNPACRKRNRFFEKLSRYRPVDSGGRFMNNVGGPVPDKLEFIRRHKFVIAFENESHPGYTTEKIVEPMQVGSLPIYWGNPMIHRDFNPASFLNHHDFGSDDDLIDAIVELDRDDNLYLERLKQPWLHGNRVPEALEPEALLAAFDRIFSSNVSPVAVRRRHMVFFDQCKRTVTRELPLRYRRFRGRLDAMAYSTSRKFRNNPFVL
ncbi:MAG: glycosyltransferase [Betaproteobacteria bacterium]|nr:glycosyltransferase [Betaproteobacteria bacterium]